MSRRIFLVGLVLVLASCDKDQVRPECDCVEITEEYDVFDNGDGTQYLGWGVVSEVKLEGYDCTKEPEGYVSTGVGERKIVNCK